MGSRPTSAMFALVSVLVVAGLGVLGWFLEPESGANWAFRIFALPALWGFVEFAQHRGEDRGSAGEAIMNWHRLLIAGVGLMTVMDLGFHLAISTDLLDADWEPRGQSVQGVFSGVGLTIWGNLLPTLASPWSLEEQPVLQDRQLQSVGDRGALLVGIDEVGLTEDTEVSRHRGLGQVELSGQLASRHRALAQELKHAAAGRVGQRFEDSVHD